MRTERIGVVGAIAGVVLGGLVAAAGCVGADDEVSGGDEAELQSGFAFHRPHRRRDAGTVEQRRGGNDGRWSWTGDRRRGTTGGGTAGSSGATAVDGGSVADCDICTQAQQCCHAVETNPRCTFSAATCASMVDAARPRLRQRVSHDCRGGQGRVVGGNPPAVCR